MRGGTAPRRSRPRKPARTRVRKPAGPRMGLALAGGGPLGGIYEVGALLALDDALDAYVGVSSGGFVAAALANGISPAQMYRLFIDDGIDAALKPEIFLRPAVPEYGRRVCSIPSLLLRVVRRFFRNPLRLRL